MEQKQKTFLQIDNDLLSATTIEHSGRTFELTFLEKGVYSYMQYRYTFLSAKGQDYFESQQHIANMFATSLKTIQRAIKKLQEVGLLKVIATSKNNKYIVINYSKGSLGYTSVNCDNMKRPSSFTKNSYVKNNKNNRVDGESNIPKENNSINEDMEGFPF